MDYLWSIWPMLLCPLLMGPLMWLAMRANRAQEGAPSADPSAPGTMVPVVGDVGTEGRLAALRTQLEDVRAQQAAIATRIELLSAEGEPADSAGIRRTGPAAQANLSSGGRS